MLSPESSAHRPALEMSALLTLNALGPKTRAARFGLQRGNIW
jgi:hypothetical protein